MRRSSRCGIGDLLPTKGTGFRPYVNYRNYERLSLLRHGFSFKGELVFDCVPMSLRLTQGDETRLSACACCMEELLPTKGTGFRPYVNYRNYERLSPLRYGFSFKGELVFDCVPMSLRLTQGDESRLSACACCMEELLPTKGTGFRPYVNYRNYERLYRLRKNSLKVPKSLP